MGYGAYKGMKMVWGKGVKDGVKAVKNTTKIIKRVPGKIVLGKFPKYLELADKLNAKRFDIPLEIWKKMTDVEKWGANNKFLDRAIARGDEIVLSDVVKNVDDVSGYFGEELKYLVEKGYRLSEDGTRLFK